MHSHNIFNFKQLHKIYKYLKYEQSRALVKLKLFE